MKLSFLRIIPACHGGNYTCHYQLIDGKHNNMLIDFCSMQKLKILQKFYFNIIRVYFCVSILKSINCNVANEKKIANYSKIIWLLN